MPDYCSAYGCRNRSGIDTNISFHRFPLENTNLLKTWLVKIRRENFKPNLYSKICSDHFKEDCFIFQNFSGRRFLKSNAVPTKFSFTKKEGSSCHIKRGCPAKLTDVNNPDWIPTKDMGYKATTVASIKQVKQYERAKACNIVELAVQHDCAQTLPVTDSISVEDNIPCISGEDNGPCISEKTSTDPQHPHSMPLISPFTQKAVDKDKKSLLQCESNLKLSKNEGSDKNNYKEALYEADCSFEPDVPSMELDNSSVDDSPDQKGYVGTMTEITMQQISKMGEENLVLRKRIITLVNTVQQLQLLNIHS